MAINLLFRIKRTPHDLQKNRQSIIFDINKKSSMLKLAISMVFDSVHQEGESTRTHYDNLEILFTAKGETADEYILNALKYSSNPRQETVVTSDKQLAVLSRHYLAKTETVEAFIQRLNRTYEKKLSSSKKPHPEVKEKKTLPELKKASPPATFIPTSATPLEKCADYYEQIFEAEWQEIQKNEQLLAEKEAALAALKPKARRPRKIEDPFAAPLLPEPSASNEMERWLILFENRLINHDFSL